MNCKVCGNKLTGRQQVSCSRSCSIKWNNRVKVQNGKTKKANMTPEQRAAKQETNKRFAEKAREEKRYLTRFDCVICGGELWHNTRHDNGTYGYGCKRKCQNKIHGAPKSQELVIWNRPKTTFGKCNWCGYLIKNPASGQKFCNKKCNAKAYGDRYRPRIWRYTQCQTCDDYFTTYMEHARYCGDLCTPRSSRSNLGGSSWIDPRLRLKIYARDNWTCHLCGDTVQPATNQYNPKAASLDHVVPRSKGGSHHPVNLKTACHYCNSIRGDEEINPLGLQEDRRS